MISKTKLSGAVFAAAFVALSVAPSFAADTQIKVTETGEGGGAMGLKLEPATVKAGNAVFHVHNDAMTENHEMIVVKLDKPDAAIPLDIKKHRIDEKKLKSLGEVSDLKPGADGMLKANLKAGTYLVFCNIKGHYEAGMQSKLVVTP
ncbi:plastocyanin/azurin family copper-binding protein [Rhizobium sp.]|jgi:uncharacterized cupredoxin-like copper-binding protein|uniref:plastocyanin/azurin family copper-binding protein n=1 Tax=Rhizobium sp. TaxID=391 RepID=UPI000E962429|nr:copper resistance protein [Rhizobium sp.]